jgi:cell fate (sporulation/competence/biofilm development) regulator YlbF (YheA/YmcA/DUF963 family)
MNLSEILLTQVHANQEAKALFTQFGQFSSLFQRA